MKREKINKVLANIVLKTAINAERKVSLWGCYQPKEPKELIVLSKKKEK